MASNAFTNQIPLYPGQPIERLTANTYLKLNSPAIKFPAFQPKPSPPPGATNTSYMFGLFPETTPANSKMDIAPTDFIAQPQDGYGMKVQKYFSNREQYLREVFIIQNLLARQSQQYSAISQMLKQREMLNMARSLRNDVRGLTERQALQFVSERGSISAPYDMQQNDMNSIIRDAVPVSTAPIVQQAAPGGSSLSFDDAMGQAAAMAGAGDIPPRHQEAIEKFDEMAAMDVDDEVSRASAAAADQLRHMEAADAGVVEQAHGVLDKFSQDEVVMEHAERQLAARFAMIEDYKGLLANPDEMEAVGFDQKDLRQQLGKAVRDYNRLYKMLRGERAPIEEILGIERATELGVGGKKKGKPRGRPAVMRALEGKGEAVKGAARGGASALTDPRMLEDLD